MGKGEIWKVGVFSCRIAVSKATSLMLMTQEGRIPGGVNVLLIVGILFEHI